MLNMKLTIGELLDITVDRYPQHDALVYPHQELRYTYKEFQRRCNQVAKGLMALGIERGEHIAIMAPNLPEWVLLQFAAARIGAVLVTINTNRCV